MADFRQETEQRRNQAINKNIPIAKYACLCLMPQNILIYFSFEASKVVTSLVGIVIFSTQFVRFTVHNLRSLDTLVSHGFGDPSITVC